MKLLTEYIKESLNKKKVHLYAVGDALAHDEILDYCQGDLSKYESMFQYIKNIARRADLAYYNQEAALSDNPSEYKGGDWETIGDIENPVHIAPLQLPLSLIDSGFNMISLANNHVTDNGIRGVEVSSEFWDEHPDVWVSGSYDDKKDEYSDVIRTVNGIRIGFLSYTTKTNTIDTLHKYNRIDWSKEKAKKDIEYIKGKCDCIIVAMHWGNEYMTEPNNKQISIADYLSKLGVDIILGSHPHVVQPIRRIGKTLVVYSLGNFIACQDGGELYKRVGGSISLDIVKDDRGISIKNVCPELNYIYYTSNYQDFCIIPERMMNDHYLKNYNNILQKYKDIFCIDTDTLYKQKLTPQERAQLLELDKQYGKLYKEYWTKWYDSGVSNQKEEFEKFIKARKQGKKYYPQLQLTLEKLDRSFLVNCRKLMQEFSQFHCFLSQYYIQKIHEMYVQAMWAISPTPETMYGMIDFLSVNIDDTTYDAAMKMLKDHPWEDVSEDQTMTGKDVVPLLQKHIDKLGYDYEAELNDNLLARMKVIPNRPALEIKTSAHYSDIDVESLKVHEVEVHCGRRYFGMLKGLYLMVDGLVGRNTLDEGMAIYNSIHNNPLGVKPNLFWKVAIKVWIARHIDKDFCELFEDIKEMCPTAPDQEIFDNLLRFKRMLKDCKLPGGDCLIQSDYFIGYEMIKQFSSSKGMMYDILHYNIGPNQIGDLTKIKEFFKNNHFEKITKENILSL